MSYDNYDKEITDVSFEILKQFLDITNSKNIHPTIIGGWATEAYYRSIGSKDIDIVLENNESIEKILDEKFMSGNEDEEVQQGWPLRYTKKIMYKGKEKQIVVDIFNAEYTRTDYENLGIKLDWNLTHKFREKRRIENIEFFVPKRELLIITKMIAAVDREARYQRIRSYKLRSKIWKDYHDVAILIEKNEPDREFLQKYIKETNMVKYSEQFISNYKQEDNKEILEDLKMNQKDIENYFS